MSESFGLISIKISIQIAISLFVLLHNHHRRHSIQFHKMLNFLWQYNLLQVAFLLLIMLFILSLAVNCFCRFMRDHRNQCIIINYADSFGLQLFSWVWEKSYVAGLYQITVYKYSVKKQPKRLFANPSDGENWVGNLLEFFFSIFTC